MAYGKISKKQLEILEYIKSETLPSHVQLRLWMIHLISQGERWSMFRL